MWSAEDYFRIDLAELGSLIDPGKTHLRTYRKPGRRYIKDPRGGYRVQEFTCWVAASLNRRSADTLTAEITSRMNPDAKPRRHRVTLTLSERPNVVGGKRLWLRCPDCGQHVRVVYWSGWLRCRRCARLKYRSNLTCKFKRMERRECGLHLLLGGDGNTLNPPPDERPRYMRRTTHAKLLAEYVTTHLPLARIRQRRLIRTSNAIWRKIGCLERIIR